MAVFIVLTKMQAAAIRGETREGAALDPRLVDAGPYAGSYVLPERVLQDPAHAYRWNGLGQKPVAQIDPDEAWPPVEE